jgi:acyl-coenzyme A thioesterase PaaI-like protein
MHIQYLGAVGKGDLLATGWVSRRGRSIAFCRAEVVTEDGRAIASGAMAFKVG